MYLGTIFALAIIFGIINGMSISNSQSNYNGSKSLLEFLLEGND
jgi:hypothetical protein